MTAMATASSNSPGPSLARTLAPATYLTHEPTLGIHNIDLLGLVVLVENQQVARRVKCDALNIPELLPFLAGKRA